MLLSLSARRAWIEIWLFGLLRMFASVALRKESVDRNDKSKKLRMMKCVALRKESVDRNKLQRSIDIISQRRSPQGERG